MDDHRDLLDRYPRLTADDTSPCPDCGQPTFRSATADVGRRHLAGATIGCCQ